MFNFCVGLFLLRMYDRDSKGHRMLYHQDAIIQYMLLELPLENLLQLKPRHNWVLSVQHLTISNSILLITYCLYIYHRDSSIIPTEDKLCGSNSYSLSHMSVKLKTY